MTIDWSSVFTPSLGLAEIILRGSLMYLGLFAVLRLVARRQAGSFGPADLLVIVLIADAAQNGLGDYGSVTEGLVLVLTIVAWEYAIDWLRYRFPKLRPILAAQPITLIENGKLQTANLAHEMIPEEDLRSLLREKDVLSYDEVQLARLEGDGRLSVVKRSDHEG